MRKNSLTSTKGLLELLILNIIGSHSASVQEMLNALDKVDFKVSSGTLYPLLLHMRKTGYLHKGLEQMDEGGLTYCFTLTENGRHRSKFLKKELHRINSMIQKTKVD